MPVKHLLTRGLGFSPGSIKYMITHGLSIGEEIVVPVIPALFGYTFAVPFENRTFLSDYEDRTFTAPHENRTFKVK